MYFITKQGDTRTALKARLYPVEGSMSEVTQVDFRMSDRFFKEQINRQVNVYSDPDVTVIFSAEEADRYGKFLGEFNLHFTDGRIETIPKDKHITIIFVRKAGE